MTTAPSTSSTRASRLLLAVFAGCALLLTATGTASALPPEPSISLDRTEIVNNGGTCTYATFWSVTDAKGRFVWLRVEYRIGPDFVSGGSVQLDLKDDPTAAFSRTLGQTQLEVRATLIKNNGTQIAQFETDEPLQCPSGA